MTKVTRRQVWKKNVEPLVKSRNNKTWTELNGWVENVAGLLRDLSDDYEEQRENIQSDSKRDKFDEDHPKAQPMADLASDLESFDAATYIDVKPELEEDDDRDSFWTKVEGWVGDVENAVADAVWEVEEE